MQPSRDSSNDPIDLSIAGLFSPPELSGSTDLGAVSVALIEHHEIDDALRAEWHALGEASGAPNPYFAAWFLEPAMRHLDPSDEVKLCLLRRADTGLLVGLAPVVFQKGYAKLPLKHVCVWTHRHCFNGMPLMRAGFAASVFTALFDWVDTRPEGASFFRFGMLPFGFETQGPMDEACFIRGRRYRVQEYHERAVLSEDNNLDTVIALAMSGKKRKELRRQERRFDELGAAKLSHLTVNAATTEAVVEGLAGQFLDLENAGWKKTNPDGFPLAQSVAESRFFREAMVEGARADAVCCTMLTLDEKPTAMLFTLRMGRYLAAFKTAYDEGYSAYSPGVRILIEATRAMLESDAYHYDSCARAGHPVVDGLWAERLPIAQVNVPAQRLADKTLLGTAATLEKLKNTALKRLPLG